jgi:hypothetical protein
LRSKILRREFFNRLLTDSYEAPDVPDAGSAGAAIVLVVL